MAQPYRRNCWNRDVLGKLCLVPVLGEWEVRSQICCLKSKPDRTFVFVGRAISRGARLTSMMKQIFWNTPKAWIMIMAIAMWKFSILMYLFICLFCYIYFAYFLDSYPFRIDFPLPCWYRVMHLHASHQTLKYHFWKWNLDLILGKTIAVQNNVPHLYRLYRHLLGYCIG